MAQWRSGAIQLAPDEVFLTREFVSQAATRVVEYEEHPETTEGSRRKLAALMYITIHNVKAPVFDGNGNQIAFPDGFLEKAFGIKPETAYFSDFKFLSDFKQYAERPMKRKPNKANLLRYQLIALVMFLLGWPIVVELD